MKRILSILALATLLNSCSDSEICIDDQRSDQIRLVPSVVTSSSVVPAVFAPVPDTRTSYSSGTAAWANGDRIGVFCPAVSAVNIPYTATGAGASATWASSPSIYWIDGTTLHKFLAYYPYASGNTNSAAVPLPTLSSQTGTINPAYDFMLSNNQNATGVLRASDPVPLIFTHGLTLIELKIQLGGGISTSGTTLTNFVLAGGGADKLYTTDNTSTIALTTGLITVGAATNTATLTPASAPALSTSPTTVYALILPGTYLSAALTVTISEGGTTSLTTPSTSLGTLAFLAGTKYSYTVTISRNTINISNPTITDWTTVTGTPLNPTI